MDTAQAPVGDEQLIRYAVIVANPTLSSADDWSGLSSSAERRKRQNRLNQRLWRERRKLRTAVSLPVHPRQDSGFVTTLFNCSSASSRSLRLPSESYDNQGQLSHDILSSNLLDRALSLAAKHPSEHKRKALFQYLGEFHRSYVGGNPMASHLLTLTRVNVYRAFINNMLILGIDWKTMEDDSISLFLDRATGTGETPGIDEARLPPSLRPTALQKTGIHHPWLDIFPSPVMRDNLVKAGNEWDDEELCTDIQGFWDSSTGPHGLIVWDDPCTPAGWEVSPGFAKKWGWTIVGCEDLMRSTNSWRAKRGEKPLFL